MSAAQAPAKSPTRDRPRLIRRALILLTAAGALAVPGAAGAAPGVEFTNTGKDCRNLAIMADLDPAGVRELLPARFTPVSPPQGFVELAECPSGTIDGAPTGAYRIAEAAIVIQTPVPMDDPGGTITQDIFAVSQLDTNAELSRRKREVGFRSEVVDIGFARSGLLGTHVEATIPWPFSPYTMSADLTPSTPPLPITIVTRIWGLGPRGLVLTRNDIERVDEGSVAFGTATFAVGSPLARLFGQTTVQGTGIAGRGTFTNVTRIVEPAAAPAPTPVRPALAVRIENRRVVRLSVAGAGGPLVATVRRGRGAAGKVVRTLRGRSPLRWGGRTAGGARVAAGDYTLRVRTAAGARIGAVRVRLTGSGLQRLP
ncbi:hypothetical protein DSM112329_01136 [Paraconexibacter sp. AEG42_29]|uniref:FlgD Ig-like domain-containing protein n=1 Tax=Paraconexibacter sp. AEG42_29 TaxID=2997339 RepID=A0AAU7ART6_9ACTN